ncbi:hypothetical protein [Paucilactobacillus hokkaidonensis]|uniref:hypothetical protein n=1 Tax=Paucilactobacillus hokkaidonensis TaxID=1193095 RepID=UPI0006D0B46E|nr:hypothetical protein [Paucilactobacillus hokkaidonensis]
MTNLMENLADDCRSLYEYIKNHIWLDDLVRADICLVVLFGLYNLVGWLASWYLVGVGRILLVIVLMDAFFIFRTKFRFFWRSKELIYVIGDQFFFLLIKIVEELLIVIITEF